MTAFASIGPDIPHPLLAATGRYAGLLPWNVDRDFPQASQWLESKFPLWAFSVMEDWASGAFDYLSAVVFSRGDDASQRLYYYLCELRRRGLLGGPEPLILDVARIQRPGSGQRSIDAVRKLAARLGVDDAALEQAIVAANGAGEPAPLAQDGPRCLLGGTLPPDGRVHDAVRAAGWVPVGETMDRAWSRLRAPVAEGTGDPCAALGRYAHDLKAGARSFHDRAGDMLARAAACGAAAAVLWYAEEDEAEVWNLPDQRCALDGAGIPALVLTRRSWRFDDGARDEIAAFLEENAR